MRIGIDAKWYFNGPPSGRIVVRNLIDQIILSKAKNNTIYLFVEKKNAPEALELWQEESVKLIFLPKILNLISNVFLVYHYASIHKLDAVLFQNFSTFLPSRWKKIVYIHDLLFMDFPEYYTKKEFLYFKPMLWLAKKSDAIITISQSEKNRLLKYHVAQKSDIFVVHHGINEKFVPVSAYSDKTIEDINSKYNLPANYLLYVGRINIRKNLLNLIKGFLLAGKTDQHLIIVGKVDHKNIDVTIYVNEHKLEDRVHFLGHVSDEDLYVIYARAFAFCFPSYAEGFGLPPLEAMKCGIPSIVSDRTSLPEVCGKAGIYINPDDPNDIANKITKLFEEESYYEKMKYEALSQSSKFSWRKAANEIMNVITN
ncbi:glycosyltransferase family 1 protein [Dyadobacter sp. LHD-138]|uniref:glycosyltransferase family 4 protein n=1 Tax=Dyadobacter sp. LHD-138 TaxID=3071413 RepID=UPI0027E0B204|nr:glycosyltransferase family 1 protein [Dyadobacter sp. LHD-138]MDQ6481564.1 glycosyltransferase family 1 protein [Dyadobacter sp. LHD-138]